MKTPLAILAIAVLFVTGASQMATNNVKERVVVTMNVPTNSWYWPAYFQDIVVYEAGTRRPFSISEIYELLDKLPNVKYVDMNLSEPAHPRYSINHLLYPQYAEAFKLTQAEWKELRTAARDKLIESKGAAADEVVKHWVEITEGQPPFGLRVSDK